MVPSEQSKRIAHEFSKYVKTGNKSLIENFTLEEIETAFLQFSRHKDTSHYEAMNRRIDELKEIEKNKKSNREKWKDRLIGAIIGLVVSLVVGLLLYWLTM